MPHCEEKRLQLLRQPTAGAEQPSDATWLSEPKSAQQRSVAAGMSSARVGAAEVRRKATPKLQETLTQGAAGADGGNHVVGRVQHSENRSCWLVVPVQTCSTHMRSSQPRENAGIARDVLEIYLTLDG
jgi:hypothetical protein